MSVDTYTLGVLFSNESRKLSKSKVVVQKYLGEEGYLGTHEGKPVHFVKGKVDKLSCSILQERKFSELCKLVFRHACRIMRDRFYDPVHNNRNWEAIRQKYKAAAIDAINEPAIEKIMSMLRVS